MAYLAVNKDGKEGIYTYALERHFGAASDSSKQIICYEDYSLKLCDFWTIKNVGEWGFANRIFLPTGSIEKLIGRKLTWEDEPVEIK